MRVHKFLATAALAACLLSGDALGQSATDARLEALEQRIQQLEERLMDRDAAMAEKDRAIESLKEQVAAQAEATAGVQAAVAEAGESRTGGLAIGGAIEVAIERDSPYDGDSTSDLALDAVDIVFEAELSDMVSAELALTADDDNKIEVDTAAFTIGHEESPVSLTAGFLTMPFADFETGLVSDPMALEMGEAAETALQLDIEAGGGLSAALYAFRGGVDHDGRERIDNFGAYAAYAIEAGDVEASLDAGWINDLNEADLFEDAQAAGDGRVAGMAASASVAFGPASLLGHYMSARDDFDGLDTPAKPSAYGLEAGYALDMGGREMAFAVAYQVTREAVELEMPERRMLFGVETELVDGIGVAVEYARHSDYDEADGGTGKDGSTVTALISAEF